MEKSDQLLTRSALIPSEGMAQSVSARCPAPQLRLVEREKLGRLYSEQREDGMKTRPILYEVLPVAGSPKTNHSRVAEPPANRAGYGAS
jgi:hypothetical protein